MSKLIVETCPICGSSKDRYEPIGLDFTEKIRAKRFDTSQPCESCIENAAKMEFKIQDKFLEYRNSKIPFIVTSDSEEHVVFWEHLKKSIDEAQDVSDRCFLEADALHLNTHRELIKLSKGLSGGYFSKQFVKIKLWHGGGGIAIRYRKDMIVPKDLMGHVIGSKGRNIKEAEKILGFKINIKEEK